MNDLVDLLIKHNPEATVKDYLEHLQEFMVIRISTQLQEQEQFYDNFNQ